MHCDGLFLYWPVSRCAGGVGEAYPGRGQVQALGEAVGEAGDGGWGQGGLCQNVTEAGGVSIDVGAAGDGVGH